MDAEHSNDSVQEIGDNIEEYVNEEPQPVSARQEAADKTEEEEGREDSQMKKGGSSEDEMEDYMDDMGDEIEQFGNQQAYEEFDPLDGGGPLADPQELQDGMAGINSFPAMQPPPQQFLTYAVPQEVPEAQEEQEDDQSSRSRVSGEDFVPAEQLTVEEDVNQPYIEDSMEIEDRGGVPDEMGVLQGGNITLPGQISPSKQGLAQALGKALKMKVKKQHDMNHLQRSIGRKSTEKNPGEGSPFQKQFSRGRPAKKTAEDLKKEEDVSKLKAMIGEKIKAFMLNKKKEVLKKKEEAKYRELYAGTSQAFWDGFMKYKKADIEANPELDPIALGISIRKEKFFAYERAFNNKQDRQAYYEEPSTIACGVIPDEEVEAFDLRARQKNIQPSTTQQKNFATFKQTLAKRQQERERPRVSLSPLKRQLMAEKVAIASYKQTLEQQEKEMMMGFAFPSKTGRSTSMNENLKRKSRELGGATRHVPGKGSVSISNSKKSMFTFNPRGSKTPKLTGSQRRKQRINDSISESIADKIQSAQQLSIQKKLKNAMLLTDSQGGEGSSPLRQRGLSPTNLAIPTIGRPDPVAIVDDVDELSGEMDDSSEQEDVDEEMIISPNSQTISNINITNTGMQTSRKVKKKSKYFTPMTARGRASSSEDSASVSPLRNLRKLSNLRLSFKQTTFGGSPRGLFDDPQVLKDQMFLDEIKNLMKQGDDYEILPGGNAKLTSSTAQQQGQVSQKKWKDITPISKLEDPVPLAGRKSKKYSNVPGRYMKTQRYVEKLLTAKQGIHEKYQKDREINAERCPEFNPSIKEDVPEDSRNQSRHDRMFSDSDFVPVQVQYGSITETREKRRRPKSFLMNRLEGQESGQHESKRGSFITKRPQHVYKEFDFVQSLRSKPTSFSPSAKRKKQATSPRKSKAAAKMEDINVEEDQMELQQSP